jgi:hypothetical protein
MLAKFTEIKWNSLRFVITDAPNTMNEHDYVTRLKRLNVTKLVRTCELTYDEQAFSSAGIEPCVRLT